MLNGAVGGLVGRCRQSRRFTADELQFIALLHVHRLGSLPEVEVGRLGLVERLVSLVPDRTFGRTRCFTMGFLRLGDGLQRAVK